MPTTAQIKRRTMQILDSVGYEAQAIHKKIGGSREDAHVAAFMEVVAARLAKIELQAEEAWERPL